MCNTIWNQVHTAAVFSDMHSNYHALKACYEDAKLHGADCFLFLGDYVSDLADPRKTLDLVYEIQAQYPAVCLRGNRERYMLECRQGSTVFTKGSKSGSLLYTFENLREKDFTFFENLPIYDTVEINGIPFEIAHSVRNDDRCYFEGGDETIHAVFQQMEHPYFLTGHSHKQYVQSQQGKTILNPGSIGVPQGDSCWPQYALLTFADGSVHCQLRQVPYDVRKTIHAQFENGLVDYAKYWAVSVLYDIITGREYTMKLLGEVCRAGDVHDEALWHRKAEAMGMKFTEQEILEFYTFHAK